MHPLFFLMTQRKIGGGKGRFCNESAKLCAQMFHRFSRKHHSSQHRTVFQILHHDQVQILVIVVDLGQRVGQQRGEIVEIRRLTLAAVGIQTDVGRDP